VHQDRKPKKRHGRRPKNTQKAEEKALLLSPLKHGQLTERKRFVSPIAESPNLRVLVAALKSPFRPSSSYTKSMCFHWLYVIWASSGEGADLAPSSSPAQCATGLFPVFCLVVSGCPVSLAAARELFWAAQGA